MANKEANALHNLQLFTSELRVWNCFGMFVFSVFFLNLLSCPFPLLLAAFWDWKLHFPTFWSSNLSFPWYLQHVGSRTVHVALFFTPRIR
jgi:hypothetical protein